MSVIKGTDPNKNQTNAQERRNILTNKRRSNGKAKQQNRNCKKRLKIFRYHIKSVKMLLHTTVKFENHRSEKSKYTQTCTNSKQINSEQEYEEEKNTWMPCSRQ